MCWLHAAATAWQRAQRIASPPLEGKSWEWPRWPLLAASGAATHPYGCAELHATDHWAACVEAVHILLPACKGCAWSTRHCRAWCE